MSLRFVSLLIIAALALVGCRASRAPSLAREDLFEIEYGKMEDQVELFFGDGPIERKTNLIMRDGLFRVASGYGNKIMEFTSYGDLISLFYNPAENPVPVLLQPSAGPDARPNRQAFEFPFQAIGEIAISSDGSLLVEDQVPARVAEYDDDLGVMLNRIVVRFDANGNQVDYLGQEGVGTTYLPYIHRIDTTAIGDIIVTTIAPPSTIVFWYSSDGTLLRRIDLAPPNYPVPADRPATAVLESVHPDRLRRRLYAKFDYHIANPQDGRDLLSRIYWLDIADGVYGGFVDVPENSSRVNTAAGEREIRYQYEFIGTAPGDRLFLLSQESDTTSELLILTSAGRVTRRRTLEIDYSNIVFRDLHISDTGILSGLFASRDSARVVWWRTDRLISRRDQ